MRVGIRKGALFVMRDMQVIWSMEFPCLLVCQSAIFIDSKKGRYRAVQWQKEPRWTGRFDISSTGGAFGSVLQRARVMTETTRISAMEIRMSLANTRTREALAAAEAFISTHGNEVNDEEDGIGSVIYWTVEVERRVEYKENEWLPCDESGRIDDGYGNEPNATVAYLSSLEGSREERAFELAKNEYLAWLEHKADRYTTVYGYMD